MEKRSFVLSVLLTLMVLFFAFPVDAESVRAQIVSGRSSGYNNGRLGKSVSTIAEDDVAKDLQLASAISLYISIHCFNTSLSVKNTLPSSFHVETPAD